MDRFDWIEFDQSARAGRSGVPEPRMRPTDGLSFYRAAREMRQAGHFKAAADCFRKTLSFDDHHYGAWVALIDTLVRAKRLDEADAVSEEAIGNYRQVRPLYAARALVLAVRGMLDQAWPLSDVSVEGGDRSWYARCVRGELYLRQDVEERKQALELFEEAMELAQRDWEAPLLAGWALLDVGLPVLAAGFFAEAAHCNPRAPLCWLCLGDAFHELRLYDQALFYYQRVTELEPAHEAALERQRKAGPALFGLMNVFRRESLRERWRKEYEDLP